jgi:hypothetical protein
MDTARRLIIEAQEEKEIVTPYCVRLHSVSGILSASSHLERATHVVGLKQGKDEREKSNQVK